MANQLENIGLAISGFGAGLQGNLPQFQAVQQQGKVQDAQLQMQQQEQKMSVEAERQKTMFMDAAAGLALLDNENYDGLVQLGMNRLQLLRNFPDANPEDTQRLTKLAVAAKNGNEEAREHLRAELENTVQIGQSIGILKMPEAPEGFTLAPDAIRFDAQGNEVARGMPSKTAAANGAGNASAVSRVYDNGTTLMVLPNGTTEVQGPDGNILTGENRIKALRAAREEEIAFASDKKGATTRSGSQETRLQNTIDMGLDAAQGAANLKRSIELLDRVETGGFDSARIAAKQLFGVESADEGELASSLGKAVLSQLRSTFGAAFTEREGARLEGIEARMGASPSANKRLLQQTYSIIERAANRAIDAAYETGDDRTAQSIEELLDFQLTDDGGTSSSGIPKSAVEAGVSPEEWRIMPPEDQALFK